MGGRNTVSLAVAHTLLIIWGYAVAANTNVVHETSSLVLANALTGATITSTYNSLGGAIVASPDGTHVYSAGYELYRYDIVGATMKQVDASGNFSGAESTTRPRGLRTLPGLSK